MLALLMAVLLGLGAPATTALAQNTLEKAENVKTPVEQVTESADAVEQTISILERLTTGVAMDDEAYVGAQVKYQNLLSEINQIIRDIDTQSEALAVRLTEIGPPPDDANVVEPRTVTETRSQLNNSKSGLAVKKTELEKGKLVVQNALNQIAKARQEAFTEAISKRTEVSTDLIAEGFGGITTLWFTAKSHFANWFVFVVQNKFWAMMGSTAVSLALALFLSSNFNRYFGASLERRASEPDYFTRVFTAFWATISAKRCYCDFPRDNLCSLHPV